MQPDTLGHYQLEDVLGEGGMGVVYRAKHVHMGKTVAVKQLLPKLSDDRDIVERFFNEARAAAAIDHPGIVEVLDVGYAEDGSAYLVMECLRGHPLSARIKQGPLSEAAAKQMVAGIADILAAAHDAGIVHRDLKPDNIFLVDGDESQIKILDFGIAKLSGDISASTSKTKTGAMMGSPLYMSPEQCKGAGKVDGRSDIYSLGCVAYELVCGSPPFGGDGVGEVLGKHMYVDADPLRKSVPVLSQGFEDIVLRMLAKEPDDRFQSMGEVISALASGRTRRARSQKNSRLPLIAGALLLCAAAGGLIWQLSTAGSEESALLADAAPIENPVAQGAGEEARRDEIDAAPARPVRHPGRCGRSNPGLRRDLRSKKIATLAANWQHDIPVHEDFASSYLGPEGDAPGLDAAGFKNAAAFKGEPAQGILMQWGCRYGPANLSDGDTSTAWVEGAEGDGIGEVVVAPLAVGRGVEIWAGYGKSPRLFKRNGRPKDVRVYVLQPQELATTTGPARRHEYKNVKIVGSHKVTLLDVNGYQDLPLPPASIKLGSTQLVAIEILSVYPGDKYPDTCISELRSKQ